ncbi:YlqD family protein [Candidatus Margulisiibacteriota bacterium]
MGEGIVWNNVDSVRLKRSVTIKVIVTEDFKKYLKLEIEKALENLDRQMQNVEGKAKQLIQTLEDKKGDSAKKQVSSIKQQVQMDRYQQMLAKTDLEKRKAEADTLAIGSEFLQGTIDSFVDLKKGDNLYKKLGGMEVIIKDGEILDIREPQ